MSSTVLAIDDSPDILALLAVHLRPDGVKLITATEYHQGLATAASAQPDLILLDVDLAGESGLDLCRRLKAEAVTAEIPVIFLTGSDDVETKVHGFDLGAVDYVTKPFHAAELRARVRAALRTKRCQDMLAERARVDALTGLHNRAYFDERLKAELEAGARTGRPTSLILLDLDHFKSLNDNYGHPFGDLVLQRVGELVARSVRTGDAACRYGGEEIAIILPDTTASAAREVAERMRQRLQELPFTARSQTVVVTGSFGVAEGKEVFRTSEEKSPAAVLRAADDALYSAKRSGRNRVALWGAPPAVTDAPPRSSRAPKRVSLMSAPGAVALAHVG